MLPFLYLLLRIANTEQVLKLRLYILQLILSSASLLTCSLDVCVWPQAVNTKPSQHLGDPLVHCSPMWARIFWLLVGNFTKNPVMGKFNLVTQNKARQMPFK